MSFRDVKANARESLKGHWGVAILASIITGAFSVSGSFTSSGSEEADFSQLAEFTSQELLTTIAVFGGVILLGLIISLVISSLVSIGYAQFNIDLIDGVEPKIITLFSKGKQVWTAIKANILVFIRITVGFIFLIIPGIVAVFRYSMVNYVIAENPGISAREALEMSNEIMKGNKLRLFFFGLSFLGSILLVVITLGIAAIWVIPYMNAAYAGFYREIA